MQLMWNLWFVRCSTDLFSMYACLCVYRACDWRAINLYAFCDYYVCWKFMLKFMRKTFSLGNRINMCIPVYHVSVMLFLYFYLMLYSLRFRNNNNNEFWIWLNWCNQESNQNENFRNVALQEKNFSYFLPPPENPKTCFIDVLSLDGIISQIQK